MCVSPLPHRLGAFLPVHSLLYKINTFPRCSSWGVGGLQPVCLKLEGLLEILWARESLTAVLIV